MFWFDAEDLLMKEFLPLDVARILRAMDEAEYASIMREHAIDIIQAGNEARAYMLTEAGSRAWFVLNPDEVEYSFAGSPRTTDTTIVTYGPTRGLLGDFIYNFSEKLKDTVWEKVVSEFLEFLRHLPKAPRR